ncbi:MAG: hypothetical protein JNJ88_18260 [Planctomycetes bacterium]|nr:hypothetical protein [Planctomycetota bacterium]
MLLQREALEAGNPLATYAAMLDLEDRYRRSKPLAGVYDEVRFNFEEFLGFPMAGVRAMSLPAFRADRAKDEAIPDGFVPEAAVDVVERAARKTRVVIWAEEHHLPQTRSLFEPLLRRLWNQGYRYLAAESFSEQVMESNFEYPNYRSGYYIQDPVFASAIRTAKQLGYKLIAYDTRERGPEGDNSFRDRTQAAHIKARVLDRDADAKVFVIAGRLHASEMAAADGWTPMAAALKQMTGIDPFTIYAPTMSQRLTREEEHPWYRAADSGGFLLQPTIFVEKATGRTLGFDPCDAYVFWPRFEVKDGRPDWMMKTLGRKPITIPDALRAGSGRRLVQAFVAGEPSSAIPADQLLLERPDAPGLLMLPAGKYRLRAVDERTTELGSASLQVP